MSHFSLGLLAEASGDSIAALRELEAAIQLDPGEKTLYAPAAAVALKTGQPDKALRIARQLKKQHPQSIDSILLLARVAALSVQPAEAEVLFKQAVLNFPDDPETHLGLAQLFLSQKRMPEAIQTLESAMEQLNEPVDLLHLLGTLIIESAREQTDPQQAQKTIRQGMVLLEKALEIDPSDPKRWQQLGYVYLSIKQIEPAQEALEKARSLMPSDLELARQILDLALQTGDYDRALELCDTLPAQTGADPDLWLQYLADQTTDEHLDELIAYLEEQLLQKNPPVFYYAQLSSIYLDHERYAEAESTLLKALDTRPEDNRLRTVLGYLRLRQEKFDEAYADFNQIRTEAPEDEWAQNPFFAYNFMVAAQKSGHLEEAATTLAATHTNNPVVLNEYMHSLLTGESPVSHQAAIDLLNAFHRMSPEAVEAVYYLTLLQAEEEDYETALENARRFEVLARDQGTTNLLNGFFYYQYGSLYERTGQFEEAEKQFFKAIETGDPETVAAAQNYIAYMWAERGEKLERSLALIEKALAGEPDNAAFLDTLGWIYYMQGRYEEALEQLKTANGLMDGDPTIWEHLGDTYQKLGDRNEASKHWKKALDLAPDRQLLKRLENKISPDSP
ncbi:MAG: tetratricopeptide repeat protein [Verrucomicrobia bacterium]|nr:tetratricopeptide repeat protein [Verrucomicrobiota bacterium]